MLDADLGNGMGLLGDFAKGFLIYMGICVVLALIGLVVVGLTVIALLLFVALLIPASWVAFEYYKYRKEKK